MAKGKTPRRVPWPDESEIAHALDESTGTVTPYHHSGYHGKARRAKKSYEELAQDEMLEYKEIRLQEQSRVAPAPGFDLEDEQVEHRHDQAQKAKDALTAEAIARGSLDLYMYVAESRKHEKRIVRLLQVVNSRAGSIKGCVAAYTGKELAYAIPGSACLGHERTVYWPGLPLQIPPEAFTRGSACFALAKERRTMSPQVARAALAGWSQAAPVFANPLNPSMGQTTQL